MMFVILIHATLAIVLLVKLEEKVVLAKEVGGSARERKLNTRPR